MDEGSLPAMPDSLDSETAPVYCTTITDAKAQYSFTSHNLVELQCRPFSSATSTQFTLGQDNPTDSITVYYTNSASLGTGRINKIVGTIQKDTGDNYWLEVDSGTNWTEGDFIGNVQTAPEGSIAWAKTFGDGLSLSATLAGKVVSRTFPSHGYYYIQEPTRAGGIRVNDYMTSSVAIGDIVDVEGEMASDDGERVINATSTTIVDSATIAPLGLNNKSLAGGSFNALTLGAYNAFGLNNVGLLARTWGKVTAIGSDYFYFDDGSNCDDGSGSSGVRVVGVSGYMPSVNDIVAVTGISGLATHNTSLARTVRLARSSDISGISPPLPPTNLNAVTTGSGKVVLYWNSTPNAEGYNIYRGTTSDGENYTTPVNGGTPVNTPSYSGSSVYSFTDTGLTNGVEYFYTVKAVSGTSESQPSNEDSDVPKTSAVPWDSTNPGDVLSAFRSIYPDTEGQLRVVGPDGRVYQDGESTILPPDGYVIPGTNQFVSRHDGTTVALFDDSDVSGMQALVVTLPAADGPYRRVRSKLANGYTGAQGLLTVPQYAGTGCWINQKKGDAAYIILGSSGRVEVDAGLMSQWLYGQPLPEGGGGGKTWAPYLKSGGHTPEDLLVNMPDGNWARFNPNQDLEIRYVARTTLKNQKVCMLKVFSESQSLTRTLGSYVGYKDGESVRIKRMHSIAQSGAKGWKGVKKTGSYCQRVYWNSGQLRTSSGGWTNWSSSTSDEDGKYTGGIATVTWTATSPYVREDNVIFTIPSQ